MVAKAFALAMLSLMTVQGTAIAQEYPAKPINLVVPYTAGSSAIDVVSRFIANELSTLWGKSVVIDNRPGAGGAIGTSYVARSPADGYTLLFVSGAFTMNAAVQDNLSYDPINDLTPVGILGMGDFMVVAGNHTPGKTMAEFVEAAKSKKMLWASGGPGTGSEFGAKIFLNATGINLTEVPYKGGAGALVDMMGGRIDLYVGSIAGVGPFVKEGKIKGLAVMGANRSKTVPDVPTLTEQGVTGADIGTWWGVFVPSKTPPDIAEKLNAALIQIMKTPAAAKFMAEQDAVPLWMTLPEASNHVRTELKRWQDVVKAAGKKPE